MSVTGSSKTALQKDVNPLLVALNTSFSLHCSPTPLLIPLSCPLHGISSCEHLTQLQHCWQPRHLHYLKAPYLHRCPHFSSEWLLWTSPGLKRSGTRERWKEINPYKRSWKHVFIQGAGHSGENKVASLWKPRRVPWHSFGSCDITFVIPC